MVEVLSLRSAASRPGFVLRQPATGELAACGGMLLWQRRMLLTLARCNASVTETG